MKRILASLPSRPINPKRIQLVRDFRMLDEEDWPDDMRGEKMGHFCMLTGFPMEFFRQDDPPDFGEVCFCENSGNFESELGE